MRRFTPAYAVYESDAPTRVVLLNYVSDPSGGSDVSSVLSLGSATPDAVSVRHLRAPDVAEQYNITWCVTSRPFC